MAMLAELSNIDPPGPQTNRSSPRTSRTSRATKNVTDETSAFPMSDMGVIDIGPKAEPILSANWRTLSPAR
jgi:hypothetical protein